MTRGGQLARHSEAANDVVASLFRVHGLSLIRMALLLTGAQATAEDVVQDAFLGFHRALPRLQDQDNGWLGPIGAIIRW